MPPPQVDKQLRRRLDFGARTGGAAAARRDAAARPRRRAPATALAALTRRDRRSAARGAVVTAYGELAPELRRSPADHPAARRQPHGGGFLHRPRARPPATGLRRRRRRFPGAGQPHVGVRSALFSTDATDDWSYEALQRSDDRGGCISPASMRVAHHADGDADIRVAQRRPYDAPTSRSCISPAAARRRCCSTANPPARSISTAASIAR